MEQNWVFFFIFTFHRQSENVKKSSRARTIFDGRGFAFSREYFPRERFLHVMSAKFNRDGCLEMKTKVSLKFPLLLNCADQSFSLSLSVSPTDSPRHLSSRLQID